MHPSSIPPSIEDGSLLCQRFGPELVHYGSGSPLNRVSFLRTDADFLRAAACDAEAQYVVLNELDPLVAAGDEMKLRCLGYEEIQAGLMGGKSPPFSLSKEETLARFAEGKPLDPLIVFLGLEEGVGEFRWKRFSGRPWFVIDATPRGENGEAEHDRRSVFLNGLVQSGGAFSSKIRNMTLLPGQGTWACAFR